MIRHELNLELNVVTLRFLHDEQCMAFFSRDWEQVTFSFKLSYLGLFQERLTSGEDGPRRPR